jgi:chromatin segregation and condensation protein Rec8/ScpA/Scc1 (kleisin family)
VTTDVAEAPIESGGAFSLRLENFEGPFDLLLNLIAKHKLDITEVALSKVTDEFIAHIKMGSKGTEDQEPWDLEETSQFLLVAATLLPEVLIGIGLDQFAALAAKAMEPKPVLELSLAHIHAPTVSVKEQAAVVVDRLRRQGTMTFRALAGDAPDVLTRVARFLSLLELFREGAVSFDQVSPLGELTVRWTGSEEGEVEIHDEFDGAPPEEAESDSQPEDEQDEQDQERDEP